VAVVVGEEEGSAQRRRTEPVAAGEVVAAELVVAAEPAV
jgi:hypothetical protein